MSPVRRPPSGKPATSSAPSAGPSRACDVVAHAVHLHQPGRTDVRSCAGEQRDCGHRVASRLLYRPDADDRFHDSLTTAAESLLGPDRLAEIDGPPNEHYRA